MEKQRMTVASIQTAIQRVCPKLGAIRDDEQADFATFLRSCASNNVTLTAELVAPYTAALNAATRAIWRKLYDCGYTPGKTPTVAFHAHVTCTAACQNSQGFTCDCSCGGANHGIKNIDRRGMATEQIAGFTSAINETVRDWAADANTAENRLAIQLHRAENRLQHTATNRGR